jgi:hypothetical protein
MMDKPDIIRKSVFYIYILFHVNSNLTLRGHRGRDRIVVRFPINTCAISAYHH